MFYGFKTSVSLQYFAETIRIWKSERDDQLKLIEHDAHTLSSQLIITRDNDRTENKISIFSVSDTHRR